MNGPIRCWSAADRNRRLHLPPRLSSHARSRAIVGRIAPLAGERERERESSSSSRERSLLRVKGATVVLVTAFSRARYRRVLSDNSAQRFQPRLRHR